MVGLSRVQLPKQTLEILDQVKYMTSEQENFLLAFLTNG